MDKHGENCNCGNDCNCNEEERDTVTLTMEDDTEVVCDIICVFPCQDKEYIALLPQDAGEDGDIYLYQFIQSGDEEIELVNIEDDAEFEAVSDAFDEYLDSEEFDEMLGDDEEEDGE